MTGRTAGSRARILAAVAMAGLALAMLPGAARAQGDDDAMRIAGGVRWLRLDGGGTLTALGTDGTVLAVPIRNGRLVPGKARRARDTRLALGQAAGWERPPVDTPDGKAAEGFIPVTTYYGTTRGRSDEPAKAYNAEFSPLSYGQVVVSVPRAHILGRLELPLIWRLEFKPDPERHFTIRSLLLGTAKGAGSGLAGILDTPRAKSSKSLLLFVHGYNMAFAETALRTAQLVQDLEFPGVPFFFSWPSAGEITGYWRDAELSQLSEAALDRVLDDLMRLPFEDIFLIAHGMGCRIAAQVLKARVDKGNASNKLREVILMAPDINADLFRKVIAPKLATLQGTRTTIYTSATDLTLVASKTVRGDRRVGATAEVYPGLETIDASRAAPAKLAFGSSQLTDSAAVLKDIRVLLRGLSARERGLTPRGAAPDVLWQLR